MKNRELIQAFEKAKTQTKCEATRVLDRLSGVMADPFAKKERVEIKHRNRRPLETGQDQKVKSD
jgi:hypothetical protein